MRILETAKIKYLICLQFGYNRKIKKFFFANFNNYSRDYHSTTVCYQNVKFCDMIELWKKLRYSSFFHKRFDKSHFKIGAMKISTMAR